MVNIVDDLTIEWLRAVTHKSNSGRSAARELTDLVAQRGKPGLFVTVNNVAGSHGRFAKGERSWLGFPRGLQKTPTLVTGLRISGMVTMMLDSPINGDWFEAYMVKVLVSELRLADIDIGDYLVSTQAAAVRERIEGAGATLRFLAPYSPEFRPIEKAFSRLTARCAKRARRLSAA